MLDHMRGLISGLHMNGVRGGVVYSFPHKQTVIIMIMLLRTMRQRKNGARFPSATDASAAAASTTRRTFRHTKSRDHRWGLRVRSGHTIRINNACTIIQAPTTIGAKEHLVVWRVLKPFITSCYIRP